MASFDYCQRLNFLLSEQERRVRVRLRVLRELRQRNDDRLARIEANYEDFAHRNAMFTIAMMRKLRLSAYSI